MTETPVTIPASDRKVAADMAPAPNGLRRDWTWDEHDRQLFGRLGLSP